MAEIQGKYVQYVFMDEGDEEEKWAKHYSSNHQILLVGEGDFSFALSLATSFGSASNIVASTLDSYDDVIKKYESAITNLYDLGSFGAQLLHGVDATKMNLHTDLQMRKFDRIVYNFPHAGFWGKEDDIKVIKKHKKLVRDFFMNTSVMLRPNGEVHVTHKTTYPYIHWNIKELAAENCLALVECVKFKLEDYPGYHNKRGDGHRCDDSFPLGESSTFKFVSRGDGYRYPQQPQQIPLQIANASMVRNRAPVWNHSKCNLIFKEYFERYKAENCGNPVSGYINILEDSKVGSTSLYPDNYSFPLVDEAFDVDNLDDESDEEHLARMEAESDKWFEDNCLVVARELCATFDHLEGDPRQTLLDVHYSKKKQAPLHRELKSLGISGKAFSLNRLSKTHSKTKRLCDV